MDGSFTVTFFIFYILNVVKILINALSVFGFLSNAQTDSELKKIYILVL